MIEGKRNRGRPRKRRCDNIHEWSCLDIDRLNYATKDRSQWKMPSHVSAQSSLAEESETRRWSVHRISSELRLRHPYDANTIRIRLFMTQILHYQCLCNAFLASFLRYFTWFMGKICFSSRKSYLQITRSSIIIKINLKRRICSMECKQTNTNRQHKTRRKEDFKFHNLLLLLLGILVPICRRRCIKIRLKWTSVSTNSREYNKD